MIKTILKILIVYTISLATMSWGEVQAYTWTTATDYTPCSFWSDGGLINDYSINITTKDSTTYYNSYLIQFFNGSREIDPYNCSYITDTHNFGGRIYNFYNGVFISDDTSNDNGLFFSKNTAYSPLLTVLGSMYADTTATDGTINFYNLNPTINSINKGSTETYENNKIFGGPFNRLSINSGRYIAPNGLFYGFDDNFIYRKSNNTDQINLISLSNYTSFVGYIKKIYVNDTFITLTGYNANQNNDFQTLVCRISDNSCVFYNNLYIFDLTVTGFLGVYETDGIDNPKKVFIKTINGVKSLYALRSGVWQKTTIASSELSNDGSFTSSSGGGSSGGGSSGGSSSSSSGGSGSGSLFDLTIFSDFFSGFTTWLDDFIGFFTGFSDHFFDNEFYGTGITEFSYTGLVSFSSLEEGRSLTAPIYTANSPIFSITQTNSKYYHNENIFNYYFENSRVNDKSEFSMYNEAVNHSYFFYKKFNYLNNSGFYQGKILTFNKNFFENFNFLPFYLKIFSIEISNGINTAIYYLLYILVGFLYLIFEFVNFFGQFFYIIPLEVGQCYNYLGQSLCFNDFSGGNRLNTVNYYSGGDLLFFVIIILFLTKILKKFFKY